MNPLLLAVLGAFAAPSVSQTVPSEWAFSQPLRVPSSGLVKVRLPLPVISEAQPSLGDLRLFDPAGQETAFLIQRPARTIAESSPLESFQTSLSDGWSSASGRVSRLQGDTIFEGLRVLTPAPDFLKAAIVEISQDCAAWRIVARGQPLFRMRDGAEKLDIAFPPSRAACVRLTLDDHRSQPVPVQGLSLRAQAAEPAGLDRVAAAVLDESSDASQTRLRLQLPAANLLLASLRLETAQPLFMRHVTLHSRVFRDGSIQEDAVGEGTVYRMASEGTGPAESLRVALLAQVPGREIVVRITNGDSRPLAVRKVEFEVIPAELIFFSQQPGGYTLLAGNPAASPRTYDVASFASRMKLARFETATAGPLTGNPGFKPAEPLPGVPEEGSSLDVSAWRFRKKVRLAQPGIQSLELDLEALSHDQNRIADLRLLRDGRQVPYVLDNTGVSRSFTPQLERLQDSGRTSRWQITLPFPDLPVTHLLCSAGQPMFQRSVRLFGERQDQRGDTIRELVGTANWTRTLYQVPEDLALSLDHFPAQPKLSLEIENGDNPPLRLRSCQCFYRSPRLLFKASPGKDLFLYYGQADASSPTYDLSLAARELLSAQPAKAELSPEEPLKVKPWWEAPKPAGAMRYVFWGGMVLVVAVLLLVIVKLLPAEPEAPRPKA
ncbi:MAG: DUF3999 family protein [Elusimicrobia bacterium]|nr:DUF3999 family protein [Elusimicrobiota bacterium]